MDEKKINKKSKAKNESIEEESTLKLQDFLATTSQRILSAIIDNIIIDAFFLFAFLVPIILRIIWIYNPYPVLLTLTTIFWALLVPLAIIGMFLYLILLPLFKEQTIGQKTMKISPMIILDVEKNTIRSFSKKDFKVISKRVFSGIVDALFFGVVGIYFMSNHPLHQAFCDRLTNVVVITSEGKDKLLAIEEKKTKRKRKKKENNTLNKIDDEEKDKRNSSKAGKKKK